MIDVGLLNHLADKCRQGLQSLANKPSSMFMNSPNGSCGPKAELVGRVLKEEAGYDGAYVCGLGMLDWFRVKRTLGMSSASTSSTSHTIILRTLDCLRGTGWHAEFEDLAPRDGFCMPSGWPYYPFDGYLAIKSVLAA